MCDKGLVDPGSKVTRTILHTCIEYTEYLIPTKIGLLGTWNIVLVFNIYTTGEYGE